ncbi:MAG: matrixin family metalloprotease, partial [Oscillospiraceae bacterium]|nr:matrixin family metalloprotease [Oscillospiraceae bacterium]
TRFVWHSILFRSWIAGIGLPLPLIVSFFEDCYNIKTKSHLFGKAEVVESDINMNSYHAWSDGAQEGCYDFYSAFLHETGHVVGFNHETMFSDSVMYPEGQVGQVKRTLSNGDLIGLNAIYK